VAGCGDPRSPVNVEADVALVGSHRLAGVQAHPNTDRAPAQGALSFCRRAERVRRTGEGDEERVALRIDLDTAVAREGLPQHPPVLGQCVGVGVAELLQ
jgi:hypothetical protein